MGAMSKTTLDVFLAKVAEIPTKSCVHAAGRSMTFTELDRASDSLARHLLDRGVQRGDHVGISLDRTVDMMAAIFAVWKAGAAYVPIDPTYPRGRIQHMVTDSGARLVVTESSRNFISS